MYLTSLAARDLPDAAFDAILSSGKARVRVRDHRYTDSEFQRRAVVLDETRELAVAVREGPRPGP
jgi:hypothetical protein